MEVNQLHDQFSAEVKGINFQQEQPDDIKSELIRLLAVHKVLLFRDQDLTTDQLVRFGEIFGRVWGADDAMENNKSAMVDNNDRVYLVSDKGMLSTHELGWHCDLSWWPCTNQPARVLYGVNIDSSRIQTPVYFFDLQYAYDSLDVDMKKMVGSCSASYRSIQNTKDVYVDRQKSGEIPPMTRSMVLSHPYTGRLGLSDLGVFLTASGEVKGNGFSINGPKLKKMVTDILKQMAPNAVWNHVYRNGDLLIHDNITTMHARPKITGTVEDRASRELKRLTLDVLWHQYPAHA
jgi:alpha-ketoglutarate-dependent taurine dioxygenase